ncbi:hypothetical protein [Streptomyces paromomycinus]|uniref:PHA accumulation regulator DNA-binding N-terminal domain-containing protein n=1 Tax=Streptomyces paromomycinus TaxID=92743 RepID=A0A401VXV7_STREY|nr:hypothetical protein [Streptomyces paromomycinus]GCD41914.1 hypothetical protein GKJPGBOP_01572 [Streptomyces paromomycinus]
MNATPNGFSRHADGSDSAAVRTPSGPPPERLLSRHFSGQLYDIRLQEPVSVGQLAQELRAGRTFRAHDHATGCDCSFQVLAEVLTCAVGAAVLGAGDGLLRPGTLLAQAAGQATTASADPG